MQNREIGMRAFAGVGHGHADGSDNLPPPPWLKGEWVEETSGRHSIAKSPARAGKKSGKSRGMASSTNGIPTSIKPRKVPCAPSCRAGRRLLPVPGCSGNGKLEQNKSGAGNRRQRLVRHIPGHSVGFSALSAANGRACLQRWASTTEGKNFQVGPRRLPPHPSRTTWSCSIWLPREQPLPRNNLHSKDLEGASGKERGGWSS